MCGIVGFITTEKQIGSTERKRWFLNAIRAGVVRGDDGTGMFLVNHDQKGSADWCKMGSPPEAFLATEQAQARTNASNDWSGYRAVIGHNRSATIGNVNTANAHPFQEGPITLVHNGTLNTMGGLPVPKHKAKGADVDSHVITHNLATHTVQEVVKELDGAYVLVWHDARDQSVNIIRNDRRPLHILPLKYHNTLLLASEAEMLWWLTDRSTFTPDGAIYYPEPGQLLKFTPDSHKPRVSKLEMHSYTAWASGMGGGRNHVWDSDDYGPYYGHGGGPRRTTNRPNDVTMEGSNTGKGPSPWQSDGPYINQAALNRRIPKQLTKTLDDLKLDCRDKLRFEVIQVEKVLGGTSAIVKGRLIDVRGQPWAHLYGLSYDAVQIAKGEETWTVAPNGMKDVGLGLKPVVLARLLSRTSVSPPRGLPVVLNSDPKPSVSSLQTESSGGSTDGGVPTVFYGPDGGRVSQEEWVLLTVKGCACCSEPMMLEFADEVWWDTVTKEPICADCRLVFDDRGDGEIDYSKAV